MENQYQMSVEKYLKPVTALATGVLECGQSLVSSGEIPLCHVLHILYYEGPTQCIEALLGMKQSFRDRYLTTVPRLYNDFEASDLQAVLFCLIELAIW